MIQITSGATAERADAARNRRRVFAAAQRLFAVRGVDAVTVDDIAHEAGVGRMTLYRRFGDKAGLARALLGDEEQRLQAAILHGPPPLGPGAAPAARLESFVRAYLGFAVAHLDVVRLSENGDPASRYTRGVYRLWHTHCRMLLHQAGVRDVDTRADLLLSWLTGELIAHRLHHGDSVETLADAYARALHDLAATRLP